MWDCLIPAQAPMHVGLPAKTAMEKQHLRGKKHGFRLETGFFSDSIHVANAKDTFELWHSPNF